MTRSRGCLPALLYELYVTVQVILFQMLPSRRTRAPAGNDVCSTKQVEIQGQSDTDSRHHRDQIADRHTFKVPIQCWSCLLRSRARSVNCNQVLSAACYEAWSRVTKLQSTVILPTSAQASPVDCAYINTLCFHHPHCPTGRQEIYQSLPLMPGKLFSLLAIPYAVSVTAISTTSQ